MVFLYVSGYSLSQEEKGRIEKDLSKGSDIHPYRSYRYSRHEKGGVNSKIRLERDLKMCVAARAGTGSRFPSLARFEVGKGEVPREPEAALSRYALYKRIA